MGQNKVRATFVGCTRFPFKMLAEDQCFPDTDKDIEEILNTIKDSPTREYSVTVAKYNERQWAIDRWKQFGWKLKKIYLT